MNARKPDSRHARLSALLKLIEGEMRNLHLWSEQPPTPSAMASRTPFCYDTMPLAAWLQWVLLPRLRAAVERNEVLPDASDIAPLAEHELRDLGVNPYRLIDLIREVDELIGGE